MIKPRLYTCCACPVTVSAVKESTSSSMVFRHCGGFIHHPLGILHVHHILSNLVHPAYPRAACQLLERHQQLCLELSSVFQA